MEVELLVNPFCMADRDVGTIGDICEKHGVELRIYNLWDIEDECIQELPDCMGSLIQEWRTGQRPGSVYCNVFINGERISLNRWPEHLKTVEQKIASALEEGTK